MLTNRYANPISDTETIMVAKAGPLETWMNMHTLDSEIFIEIPVRNGRLSGVLVKIQIGQPEGELPLPDDGPLSANSLAKKRPLPTPKALSMSAFVLYLIFILLLTGHGVGVVFLMLRKVLSWE